MTASIRGNRTRDLQTLGQSVWLDEIHRGMLLGSQFKKLVGDDGVSGVTSNPTIFAKAFAEDSSYRDAVAQMRVSGATGKQIYERLSGDDIRAAADQLRRVYDATSRRDGYVSIEVAPHLADDSQGTVSEAHELWSRIDRPNVMIKIPATDRGVHAIRPLIASGINVNATLVFGTRRYRQVAEAYLLGLEERVVANQAVDSIASVVSLFVSRIDTLIDKQLDAITQPGKAERAQRLRGKCAVAVARIAYQEYKSLVASARWQALASRHAQSQRLLWASTGTKDPRYSDVKYVDELIGYDTVNTLPLKTFVAFRDHGATAPVLERNLFDVAIVPGELQALGIDLEQISAQLEREGLTAFAESMNTLLAQLESAH